MDTGRVDESVEVEAEVEVEETAAAPAPSRRTVRRQAAAARQDRGNTVKNLVIAALLLALLGSLVAIGVLAYFAFRPAQIAEVVVTPTVVPGEEKVVTLPGESDGEQVVTLPDEPSFVLNGVDVRGVAAVTADITELMSFWGKPFPYDHVKDWAGENGLTELDLVQDESGLSIVLPPGLTEEAIQQLCEGIEGVSAVGYVVQIADGESLQTEFDPDFVRAHVFNNYVP